MQVGLSPQRDIKRIVKGMRLVDGKSSIDKVLAQEQECRYDDQELLHGLVRKLLACLTNLKQCTTGFRGPFDCLKISWLDLLVPNINIHDISPLYQMEL